MLSVILSVNALGQKIIYGFLGLVSTTRRGVVTSTSILKLFWIMTRRLKANFLFLRIVKDQIGDQRIDIVLNILMTNAPRPIYKIAREEEIQLV